MKHANATDARFHEFTTSVITMQSIRVHTRIMPTFLGYVLVSENTENVISKRE